MKNLYEILTNIVICPTIPKNYRELKEYYLNYKLTNESEAISLLEKKYGINSSDSTKPE